MLSLIGLGLLMGARDVLDIWRKVGCLSKSQRESIGLRVRDKLTKWLKMPSYDALNDLLAAVDPEAYAQGPHGLAASQHWAAAPQFWLWTAKAWGMAAAG